MKQEKERTLNVRKICVMTSLSRQLTFQIALPGVDWLTVSIFSFRRKLVKESAQLKHKSFVLLISVKILGVWSTIAVSHNELSVVHLLLCYQAAKRHSIVSVNKTILMMFLYHVNKLLEQIADTE